MKVEDLTQMEIEELRAVFPDLIKQSAPLVQITLKKLLQIIKDAEQERRNDKTVKIPLPEDVKWEAVGRGFAIVLMEKQHHIDRLEQMIIMLYENVCRDVKSDMFIEDSDDDYMSLCQDILKRVKKLKGGVI